MSASERFWLSFGRARQMTAKRAVRTVVGVEQHRQNGGSKAVRSMRDERRRRDRAKLGEERGRILDLELPMRRLVHGATVTFGVV
jgi:hypothetical protein